ncbi:MAG: oligosaccharide flippase family protein [Thermodesulfobacteriota bacterium]
MSRARIDAALRRGLDVTAAALALLLLAPLLLVLALLVRATSSGPALFVQQRIGRGGRPFGLVKFRTMCTGAATQGPPITAAGDPRVTRVGRLLRRTKLDELPQLWNVLRGDMSLVGPRPEVPRYLAQLSAEQPEVLAVRPGITDPASIAFRDEEELLAAAGDPERAYREDILPRKLELSAHYLARRSVWTDLGVVARTVRLLAAPRRPAASAAPGLRGQVVSGVKWSAIAFYSDSLLRLGISVVLARLLSPAEFGVVALAMSLVGVLALVQESGLSAALVQHRGAVDAAATAALYLTSLAGVALAVATWFASPWVAGFLEQPQLAPVLAALSLLFLLHGVAHAPKALLQREMSFQGLAAARIASTIVYGASAGGLALAGYGVWSLVLANLAAEAALTAGCWLICPWRPGSARFDVAAARELASFGRNILGANVLALLRDKLPVLVIGKLLGAELVGLFWMAQRWAALPIEGVTFVVSRVSYPAFARLREDRAGFAAGYARTLEAILLIATPVAFGLALVAEPLIATMYDARWQGAALLLAILAFYGLFHAVASSTGEVFKAAGAPRLVLIYALLYTVLLAVLLGVLGAVLGLAGAALAMTASAAVVGGVTLLSACRLLGLGAREVLRLAALPLQAVPVMTAVVVLVEHAAAAAELAAWLRLVAESALGALAYAAVVLLRRPAWLQSVRSLVLRRIAPSRAGADREAA